MLKRTQCSSSQRGGTGIHSNKIAGEANTKRPIEGGGVVVGKLLPTEIGTKVADLATSQKMNQKRSGMANMEIGGGLVCSSQIAIDFVQGKKRIERGGRKGPRKGGEGERNPRGTQAKSILMPCPKTGERGSREKKPGGLI